MIVTKSDLAQLVAKATSLSEILSINLQMPNAAPASEAQVNDNLLNQWCEVVAQGNWEKFNKRLQWDGLDQTQIGLALRSLPMIDCEALPPWATTLQEIIETAASVANSPLSSPLAIANPPFPTEKGKPLPFAEVLLPAISVARQKLLTRLACTSFHLDCLPLELLSESAYLSLELSLLHKILNISGKTLEHEFVLSRPLGQNILSLLGKSTTDQTQVKAQYQTFVQKILADGLLTFYQKYPVLARLVATSVNFWVERTAEFLQRLKADLPEILAVFQPNLEREKTANLGKIKEINASLSDPHHGGNSVIALTFEYGFKLVYKPKGLGAEKAYTQFLEWCNKQGLPLEFKVLKVCDRQTHGWVEYVEHLPCENAAAAQRFYQRSGMLLCLLYALRVVDCHRENLIANGEHLVLIDMETLMHQEVSPMADLPEVTAAETAVNLQLADSVLRTGLLPRWEFSKNNRFAYDISALGGIDLEQDNRKSGYESIPIPSNVPILNGSPLSPHDYLDHILSGFEQMYRFLIEKREHLLSANSPLNLIQNQRIRFIFRPTRIYGSILQKSFSPQFLCNGINRSIQLDILARAFIIAPNKPKAWPIFHAELNAMEQLDIPYFGAYPHSKDLTYGVEEPIREYFKITSYQEVLNQLQSFNATDLAQQLEIIKSSFYARVVRNTKATKQHIDLTEIKLLPKAELLQEATRIAKEIQNRAIWGDDGSVKWVSFAYIPNAERFQLMPLPEDLYNGNAGIALFLTALDYVQETREFRDLVFGSLQSIRKILQTADFEAKRRFVRQGIGVGTGLGSLIYALVKISAFWQETALLEDALGIANLITPELIAADGQFDTLGGTAGAILGLLALYKATKNPEVLQKAVICGQHLLANQISINGAPKAWKILGQKQYTGLSHGAAGIAYALLQLYEVTAEKAYLAAAKEGIAYERSVFSPNAANWPDFRTFAQQNGQPGFMVSWCHGATGIGLARLGGLSIFSSDEIEQDVEVALQTTQKYSLQDVDCVCCGNFGRIEMLLVAAEKLSRPELRLNAEKKAAWAVFRAQQIGGYQFPNLPNCVFSPSFFQGTAGIGYELLRLAAPGTLPSVLLWL